MTARSASTKTRSIIDASLTELVLFLVFALLLVIQLVSGEFRDAEARTQRLEGQVARLAELAEDLGRTVAALAPDLVRLDLGAVETMTPEQRLQAVSQFLDALGAALDDPAIRRSLQERPLADLLAAAGGEEALQRQLASLRAEIERLRTALATVTAERDSFKAMLDQNSGEDIATLRSRLAAAEAALAVKDMGVQALRAALVDMSKQKGLGPPPCWPTADGRRAVPLLRVHLADTGLTVQPAWPAEKQAEAETLPLPTGHYDRVLSIQEFRAAFLATARAAEGQQCRHWVALRRECTTLTCRDNEEALQRLFFRFHEGP